MNSIMKDITERKQGEKLHQILASSSPLGVYIAQEGKFVFVNSQFQKCTGFTEDELLGMEPLRLVHPEDRQMVRENEAEALRGNNGSPYEFRVVRKSRETRWAMETVIPIHYEGKRATLGNFMDITERRRMEEELATAQAEAMQVKKLAAVGKLTANAAHEINNALTVILMASSFALEQSDEANPCRSDLETIKEEALRIRNIVRNLLDFARPSQGKVREVDLNSGIQSSVALLRHQVELQGVKFREDYASEPLKVLVDENQMSGVFHNLLINALDAMPQGGCLTIRTRRENGHVIAEFRDTGVGIPPDDLNRIFEPFFTTKHDADGTGLGLPISYNIVSKFGGKIEVESQPGKGSTFIVNLPTAVDKTMRANDWAVFKERILGEG